MPKKTEIKKKNRVMLTDKELLEKYGQDALTIHFETMIDVMVSKPNPNTPTKVAKRP